MTKKWIILIGIIGILLHGVVSAQEKLLSGTATLSEITTPTIEIAVLFPKTGRSKWNEERMNIPTEQKVVSGIIDVVVRIHPSSGRHTGKDGYVIQYFVNDKLIYENKNVYEDKNGIIDYKWKWDTTKYQDEEYTLTINLWDKHASVGVGMVNVRVENYPKEREKDVR